MHTRNNPIVAALVLLSLVSGAIGCKSNGGAWYKPNSYTWHNPLKKGESIAPYQDRTATTKPSMREQPNVATPPGGYGEAPKTEYTAGKTEKQVQPHYGQTITGGTQPDAQVAMTDPNLHGGNVPAGYVSYDSAYPSTPNPYSPVTPQSYPQSYQPVSIQQSGYPMGPNPADYATPNNGVTPPAHPQTVPPANYLPFPPAGQSYDAAPQGFSPQATPSAYDQAPQQGFGVSQQGFGAPQQDYSQQQGFGTPPNSYTPPPSYGTTGYTATPSMTGGY